MVQLADYLIDPVIQENPKSLWTAKGQLTPHDRLLYYYLGKNYRGIGTIVDAGALVGGTANLMASGIKKSGIAVDTRGCIHSYDLFEDSADGRVAAVIKGWFEDTPAQPGERFNWLKIFERETAEHADLIQITAGNILEATYTDERKIEILSVDVAKTPALMLGMAKIFFPHLISAESLVVHQDYIFPLQPWLIIFMELMGDSFEKVYENRECSAVFRPTREISVSEITDKCGESPDDYYHLGNVRYLYRAIDRCNSRMSKIMLSGALAFFLAEKGELETARYVFRRAVEEYSIRRKLMESTVISGLVTYHLKLSLHDFD
jgi:hypothetical protein